MTSLSVVADASPQIALDTIDLLDRSVLLFSSCVIPPAVVVESRRLNKRLTLFQDERRPEQAFEVAGVVVG